MQLTNTILDIVQQASNYKQIKKGANEGEMMHAYDKTPQKHEKIRNMPPKYYKYILIYSYQDSQSRYQRNCGDGCRHRAH